MHLDVGSCRLQPRRAAPSYLHVALRSRAATRAAEGGSDLVVPKLRPVHPDSSRAVATKNHIFRCSISSPSSARSPARRARSARSPTASPPSCAHSASRSRRTTPAPRSAPTRATCFCRLPGRARRRYADLSLRPPRHRAAAGRDRARRRRRRRQKRRRDDPRRRQQVGRRRDGRGARGGSSPNARRMPASSSLFTPKEEVGLLGAGAFDHTRLEAELGFVYDQAAPIGERDHGRAVPRALSRPLPRPRRALGHGPGGGPLRDRRRGTGDRRPPARPARRRDDGERRHDHRRHRAQHRPGVVRARGGGALARRRASSPTSSRRCSTRSRLPRASPTARSRPRCSETYQGYRFKASDPIVRSPRTALAALWLRGALRRSPAAAPTRTSSTARAAVPQSRERHGRDPHRRRAHRRRRSRRDGRRDARAGRCRSAT